MTYPHCDSHVLHAPGECEYCDKRPDLQFQRMSMGVNFTGHYDDDKLICPAERERPLETIERWAGNAPAVPGEEPPSWFPAISVADIAQSDRIVRDADRCLSVTPSEEIAERPLSGFRATLRRWDQRFLSWRAGVFYRLFGRYYL